MLLERLLRAGDVSSRLTSTLWGWPDGLVWRLTEPLTVRSRRRKFEMFMALCAPTSACTVLDIGVSGFTGRATDFLELWYPWPAQITAVGHGEEREFVGFRAAHPQVKLVLADGRNLPFETNAFDIVFSNAVLEHVGSRADQGRFVRECLRVGRQVFLTTPDSAFPVDPHTLLPVVHWLPRTWRHWIYRRVGCGYWASESNLNLLNRRRLEALVPAGTEYRITRQAVFGLAAGLVLLVPRARE